MRRSEWLIRGLIVFCVVYGLAAAQSHPVERFPFFSWDLFSSVPNSHQVDYSIRLIDPVNRPPNTFFEDANLQAHGQEVQGYTALQRLGKAIEQHDTARVATLRRAFENAYLRTVPGVRYEVVRRSFDIRKRVECPTCYDDLQVIARYTNA